MAEPTLDLAAADDTTVTATSNALYYALAGDAAALDVELARLGGPQLRALCSGAGRLAAAAAFIAGAGPVQAEDDVDVLFDRAAALASELDRVMRAIRGRWSHG